MSLEPFEIVNPDGAARVLLVCEHASAHIPRELNDLGLAPQDRRSHAAWDPGARPVAIGLAERFDARLVAGTVSRLVYDLNRPPEAPDAIPQRSERIEVPGNRVLDADMRAARIAAIHDPFRAALAAAIRPDTVLVTIHSFTPVYFGQARPVEVGILHDTDARLADAMLDAASGADLRVERNQPYGPQHGVTHTLREHALPANLLNVMIEIRNDLIADAAGQRVIADTLAAWLEAALASLSVERTA